MLCNLNDFCLILLFWWFLDYNGFRALLIFIFTDKLLRKSWDEAALLGFNLLLTKFLNQIVVNITIGKFWYKMFFWLLFLFLIGFFFFAIKLGWNLTPRCCLCLLLLLEWVQWSIVVLCHRLASQGAFQDWVHIVLFLTFWGSSLSEWLSRLLVNDLRSQLFCNLSVLLLYGILTLFFRLFTSTEGLSKCTARAKLYACIIIVCIQCGITQNVLVRQISYFDAQS